MSKIVAVPFTFHHVDDTLEQFLPGDELPEELQNHPYALAHTRNPPKVAPKPGTPEAAAAEFRRRQRQAVLEAASEAEAEAADEQAQAAAVDGGQIEPLRPRAPRRRTTA